MQTGVGAVLNTAQVEEGSTALIIGLGGVGTSTVLGTRIAGASQVIGVDPLESRRNRAVELGLTSALDPSQVDVGEAVREQTGGIGVDYAFETVGRPDQSALAFAALRAGGLLVMVGVPGPSDTVTFPAGEFVSTERRVSGCFLGSANPHREIPRLLELWRQGNLPLEGLITGQYQLTDINLALGDARSGKGLRTVLNIGAG